MEGILKTNDTAPHTAVLHIVAHIYEKLPSGEMSGRSIEKKDIILAINGQDRFITTRKLNEIIEELKTKCQ